MMRAWHFVGGKLRNGDPVPPDGERLVWHGELAMCKSGLHASVKPFDALKYAPGPILCMVECNGEIIHDSDKLVCSQRTIIARMDATELLRYFSRMQAVSVVHMWDAQDVVLDYLMTGDESFRSAAWAAAWTASRGVAWVASKAAALDAAWVSSQAAERGDAWAAARAAAWATARASERDAAWDEFNHLVYECFGVEP